MRYFERMGMEYGRPWEWDSISGSEHSAEEEEMVGSLSDMVNSFMEKDFEGDHHQWEQEQRHSDDDDQNEYESRNNNAARLTEVELRRLICEDRDTLKATLLAEVDKAKQGVLENSRGISCRELMTRLRTRGLDAGICKSKWQKQGWIPGGDHEYIDIIINTDDSNTRYIVELSMAGLFTIARPTIHYATLLQTVPDVYVGTVEEMKQVVKLMCKAMKVSMGCRDMKVPPWRKHEYMKAKWFGCYKRSTKSIISTTESVIAENNNCKDSHHSRIRGRSVGFEVVIVKNNLNGYVVLQSCRDEVSKTRTRLEHGLLATAFRAHQQREF